MVVRKKVKKGSNKRLRVALGVMIGVLVLALSASVIFLVINEQVNSRIMDSTDALEGVTVNGVDISGMNREEAMKATAGVPPPQSRPLL